ncbi:MAG: hypothetical protein AB8B80_16310 [Marinicellaceae bacterium]
MSRYGFSFIKGSGADYLLSDLVETIVFGSLIILPLLVLFNPNNSYFIFQAFLFLFFIYALISILAEMLPKTSLYLSLLLTTAIFIMALYGVIENTNTKKLESIFFFNVGVLVTYYFSIVMMNINLIKKVKDLQLS